MELTGDEIAAIGQKIYAGIREEMEANHWGELVVIDVHSGDYEVGEYTGALSLPESAAHELGLHSARAERVTLADGRSIRANVHAARILWHGQPLDARVQTLGSYPMIGTSLLADSRSPSTGGTAATL